MADSGGGSSEGSSQPITHQGRERRGFLGREQPATTHHGGKRRGFLEMEQPASYSPGVWGLL